MGISKEQRLYLEGMRYSYEIAKKSGIQELEKEITRRGIDNIPLNVNRRELTTIARTHAQKELMYVATAMATTMVKQMKLPPSMVKDFLVGFNNLVDVYRDDPERLKMDQDILDKNFILNDTVKSFMMEGKEDE